MSCTECDKKQDWGDLKPPVPIKSIRGMLVDTLADEIVIIRKKVDKLLSGKDKFILENNPYKQSYILSSMNQVYDLSVRFNIMIDVLTKADLIYVIPSGTNKYVVNAVYPTSLKLLLDSNHHVDLDRCTDIYLENNTFENNPILMPFAEIIAEVQQRADLIFYADNPTRDFNNDLSGITLNELIPIRRIIDKLGLCQLVYREAYKIYDFRNSGRDGYTLKGGVIQKI